MDQIYWNMIHDDPLVMQILKNLQTPGIRHVVEITDQSFVMMGTPQELYVKTTAGNYLKFSSEPRLETVRESLRFILSLNLAKDNKDLTTVPGFSRGDTSSGGYCFSASFKNWIFLQYLFYNIGQ
jgi:hypothetical protein